MPITLAPNPSHLEFVNPVVVGMARAACTDPSAAGSPVVDKGVTLPILIHGDAAFPGQGIVAETLNLSRLAGYDTGGTIHIIANNQLGFTTGPEDPFSTLYASGLARGFKIPIVHVNADDPVACIEAARLAWAYRSRFRRDFLIDRIGYYDEMIEMIRPPVDGHALAATLDLSGLCGLANTGPQPEVVRAALERLRAWVQEGTAPPASPRIEADAEGASFLLESVEWKVQLHASAEEFLEAVGQAPQPAHRWGSTLTWSPSARIAPVEHTSMQRLHPVTPERLCAQMRAW